MLSFRPQFNSTKQIPVLLPMLSSFGDISSYNQKRKGLHLGK